MEYLNAFLCGGILCIIGQLLIDKTPLTPAKILVSYVTAGVILSGLGLYQHLVDWGGAGATVPLTGFGHLLAKGVKKAVAEGVQLDHHPDPSKSRGQYLPLLELSVQEDPEDDRNVHYLGREYMYRGRWDDCIRTLKRHLTMPSATWRDERAASMRYIAKSYLNKGERVQARDWYLRAIAEAPHLREPYMDLALALYEQGEWDGVLYFTGCALAITYRPRSYICEAASWGSLPHDLRSIALFHTGRLKEAREEARKAVELEPDNERLQGNLKLLENSPKEGG